jgi:hypothetical protein
MARKLSRYIEAVRMGAVIDAKMPLAGTISPAWSPVAYYETVTFTLTASSTSTTVFVLPNDGSTWQVAGVSARYTTASTSGTLQLEAAGAGVAVAGGTNQLTGTVSLSTTANTTNNGTVIASPTVLSPGFALNAIIAGTMTNLAGAVVTVILQRLS